MQEDLGPCPLCGRPLLDGPSINKHHVVPKTFGGRETHWVHVVCHTKIHSVFTERELLHTFNTFEALLEHPDIQAFVKWVQKKPPEFRDRNAPTRRKQRR